MGKELVRQQRHIWVGSGLPCFANRYPRCMVHGLSLRFPQGGKLASIEPTSRITPNAYCGMQTTTKGKTMSKITTAIAALASIAIIGFAGYASLQALKALQAADDHVVMYVHEEDDAWNEWYANIESRELTEAPICLYEGATHQPTNEFGMRYMIAECKVPAFYPEITKDI